jgi:iron complex outermembrane recepter protein
MQNTKSRAPVRPLRTTVSTGALAIALLSMAPAAWAQAQAQASPSDTATVEEIVVTGFRASLNNALAMKRTENAAVDSIVAEDIGKFPDSNLAESMQRIPGVTLSRGDGGEGRNISVRGLGPGFTRVRINGMEGAAQTGSSDIYGAGNNGRSFDFNVFPTEIFSSLAARKTASADVEEGSLGATVDLRAPRPFDSKEDQVLTATARGVYNNVAKSLDPRFSLLASKKLTDSFGVLASVAYQNRDIREVGYSAVDILSANTNGLTVDGTVHPFCTPIGYATTSPSPIAQAAKGATAANCSTNNPRTSTLAAYNTVAGLRRSDLPNTPGSGAFLPRLPRYVNSEQDAKRLGGTLSFQWKPSSDTEVALDMIYSKFKVERRDNYIAGISFGRNVNNNGQPMVSVRDIQFDSQGSLVYGLFDGVDVRSEGLVDRFTTTFKQANLDFRHRFNDKFEVSGAVGRSVSNWDGKLRLQTFMDVIDADNFSIDFRDGGATPKISYGFDVANPANFSYGPPLADGTVLGGFTAQGRPQFNKTINSTAELNGKWDVFDAVTLKFGGQFRESNFTSYQLNIVPTSTAVVALPAGTALASVTRQITGLDKLWGHGAPAAWAAIDPAKWRQATGFDNFKYCGVECGAGSSQIKETIKSAYAMADFHIEDALPIPVRGDVGMRYVHTEQLAMGHIPVAAPAGSTYPTVGQRNEVDRSYSDWLPSANVVLEFTPGLLGRLSAAKVMSRAELGSLTPSSGVNGITRTGTINNPFLDPIRADTYDAALEWYFRPGSLVSVAYFHKKIDTFIQRVTSQVPFNQLGLPDALLNNTGAAPTDVFTVSRIENTPGGPLSGVELNLQAQLDFLPGVWSHFGVLANYTHVTSEIKYILASANGVVTASTTADLTGLSRDSASGTIYYEDDRFSVRGTASYRGKYIRGIPASPGSDLQGNDATVYVDASASYTINDHWKVILEAQNLTDEQNRLYIDSKRQDTLFQTRIGRTFTIGLNARF